MPRPQVPREVLYVQKLHYLTFLCSGALLIAIAAGVIYGLRSSLITALTALSLAYLATMKKKTFIAPNTATVIQRISRSFSNRNLPSHTVAVAATQLYYLLGDHTRAESLLKSYLAADEPLVYTTLADIYLHQGRVTDALACLEPVRKMEHPLVQWTYGRVLLRQKDYRTALKHLEKAKKYAGSAGLPRAGTGFLNEIFMKWSVKSSLLHSMALCYHKLGEQRQASKCLRRGNLYLLDLSLWRIRLVEEPHFARQAK